MAGKVRVGIGADTNELRQGLDKAAGMLKGLQQQTQKAAGAARQFAGAIEAIGGASGGAASLAGNLLGAFAIGGPMGLAIGGVNALIGHFKELNAAQEAAAKASKEWTSKLAGELAQLEFRTRALRAALAGDKAGQAQAKADEDRASAQAELTKAVSGQSAAFTEAAKATNAFMSDEEAEKVVRNSQVYKDATKIVELATAKLLEVTRSSQLEVEAARKEEREAAAKAGADAVKATTKTEGKKLTEVEKANAAYGKLMNQRGEMALREMEAERQAAEKATQDFLDRVKAESDAVLSDIEAQDAATKDQIETYNRLGQAIGNALGSAQSPADALQATLGAVLDAVLDLVVKTVTANALAAGSGAAASQASTPVIGPALAIAAMTAVVGQVKGLLGSLPGRAAGGAVRGGHPYMVGERGPEVVVPGASGTVVPNHALGGGTSITIHAFDGPSVERILANPSSGLSRAIRKANRGPRV